MIRVLQAIAGAEFGGAERFFERLVPALSRAGISQRVLIRNDEKRAARLREAGIEDIHQLPFGGRFDFTTGMAVRRHAREFEADIVFTWMNRASSVAPKKSSKGPGIVNVGRLGGFYDLKYYRRCDWLIGDTQEIVDYLVNSGWKSDRAVYLPNFVDDVTSAPIPRRTFYIPESKPILLALGRLHTNKAFDVLLQALAHLPETYLLLAGEGPERDSLEALATRLGVKPRVRFLGWRDDVPALLATAQMLVHPARHEPLGNVIIEGWAHGVPIVSTASQGPSSLIEDGVTGRLVPIDDAMALASAIRATLSDKDKLQRMAEAGRQIFATNYAEAPVVARFKRFFEEITA